MPAKQRLLLVADSDPHFLKLVKRKLQFEHYNSLIAQDGEQALKLFEQNSIDILILDSNISLINPLEVCKRIREFSSLPIILTTTHEQLCNTIRNFKWAIDDFLIKPCNIEELLARVQVILHRTEAISHAVGPLENSANIGELTINYAWHQVHMAGQEIVLTPIEYRLLAYLARYVGYVVTYYQLLEHVWGNEYTNEQHILRVNINRLRYKLEPNPTQPCYILTRAGLGYMLAAHPQPIQSERKAKLPRYAQANRSM